MIDNFSIYLINSGAIGIALFWIIRKMNILSFIDTTKRDERLGLFLLLTAISLWVTEKTTEIMDWLLSKAIGSSAKNIFIEMIEDIIIVVVTLSMCTLILWGINQMLKKYDKKRLEAGQETLVIRSGMEMIMEEMLAKNSDENPQVFAVLFTVDNQFVSMGYLEYYPTKEDTEKMYIFKSFDLNGFRLTYKAFIAKFQKLESKTVYSNGSKLFLFKETEELIKIIDELI